MRLSAAQLADRRRFDYQVVSAMSGTLWAARAYACAAGLAHYRRPITTLDQAHRASRYAVTFHVPTLIGPGQIAEQTVIGFDLDVQGYPSTEPNTWIISPHVPYSPHFRRGSPVCTGEIWRTAKGQLLLGQLLNHVARLLNWDEQLSPGYQGWNGAAIAYHRRHYHGRPLTPNLRYPPLPASITHNVAEAGIGSLFELDDAPEAAADYVGLLFEVG